MSKFILTIIILSITTIVMNEVLHNNINNLNAGKEIYHAIDNSKRQIKVRRLILGDSVTEQMFSNSIYKSDSLYSLSCNQAVTMAGHFILLQNFIATNKMNLPDTVILIYHPMSLRNDTDQFTYNLFLKPFYNRGNYQYINTYLNNKIKQIPMYWASQLFKNYKYSPQYFPKLHTKVSTNCKSYIDSLMVVCERNNINFRMYAPPISEKHRANIRTMIDDEYVKQSSVLMDYFNSIYYTSDSLFTDNIHFHKNTIEIGRDYTEKIISR